MTDDYENQGNHIVRYENVDSLYCTPETNIINIVYYYTYILKIAKCLISTK